MFTFTVSNVSSFLDEQNIICQTDAKRRGGLEDIINLFRSLISNYGISN